MDLNFLYKILNKVSLLLIIDIVPWIFFWLDG